MLVFIDESGDAGFKVEQGSSPVFAAAMVVFSSADAAQHADGIVNAALDELRAYPEFKFNKTSDSRKQEFFERILACDFRIRAIVVRKDVIYSRRLKSQNEEFYRYFVKSMVQHDGGLLDGARIVIDGSGERIFRRDLQRYLKTHCGASIKSVKFADSRRDRLVQLADMVVGAIARSYRADRKDNDRWRRLLVSKIDDIWEFR